MSRRRTKNKPCRKCLSFSHQCTNCPISVVLCKEYLFSKCRYNRRCYKSHNYEKIPPQEHTIPDLPNTTDPREGPRTEHLLDFHCVICQKLIIDHSNIYRINNNAIWCTATENTQHDDYSQYNPHKGVSSHLLRCQSCKFKLGDYYPNGTNHPQERGLPLYKLFYKDVYRKGMANMFIKPIEGYTIEKAIETQSIEGGEVVPGHEFRGRMKRDTEGKIERQTRVDTADNIIHFQRELATLAVKLDDKERELVLLKSTLQDDEDHPNDCKICFELKENNVILIPCGHWLCQDCLQQMEDSCPFCRQTIESSNPLYIDI
eukprot:TRINITY_DN12215_c0_g1_i1.p1 TRINITY_DN12215_c0_g1~~TRINITY_DN12215_c0_g1_i1.p1  ORF type:complete len:331 (+),score=36.28 TRINITY_DN12215_c0_g1_i1:45-995(+)